MPPRGKTYSPGDTMPIKLLTPGQVAEMFNVDPKTVTRWCREGRLPYVRTLGGHRRYPATAIEALLAIQYGTMPAQLSARDR